jgi:acyl-CoA dehydrogenase
MRTDPVAPWPEADPSVMAPVAEHEDLRKVMRDMLQTHAPHDEVRRSTETELGYSTERWTLLNEEMNVSAMAVPETRGGLGFGLGVLSVILEEAGRALLPEPLLSSAVLGAHAVASHAAGSVPENLVAGVLDGTLVATVAVGASAQAVVAATAVDGGWLVSGVVGRALHAVASDLLVVPAATDSGHALVLLDLRGPGVTRTGLEVLDLTRRQAAVELDSVPAYVLAGPDDFDEAVSTLTTLATVALASEHVGMIDALLELTRTYAEQREQFGRSLASFQVIKHRLADMLVDLERARSAARYAAAAFDEDPAAALLPAAVAGATCTDAVIRVALDAVQLHGGVGFTWEHAAHYYVRRALGDEAAYGAARVHRADIARLIGV